VGYNHLIQNQIICELQSSHYNPIISGLQSSYYNPVVCGLQSCHYNPVICGLQSSYLQSNNFCVTIILFTIQ